MNTEASDQPGTNSNIRKICMEMFAWLAIAVVSTGAMLEIFTPQWSRVLLDIASRPAVVTSTANSRTTQTVVIDSPRLENTQVATISASFFSELINAIMEATTPATLASAEAEIVEEIEVAVEQ